VETEERAIIRTLENLYGKNPYLACVREVILSWINVI